MDNEYKELLVNPTTEGIEFASKLLINGELLSFPTETVYGLGANALNDTAVRSIFIAKGRPLTDPLIVHVANQQAALNLLDIYGEESEIFGLLSSSFWPGPLTLIAKAIKELPLSVTSGTGYVGVRIPNHPLAIELLKACQLPIAAPSANRFGHISPTKSIHVINDLGCKGVRVLNGECSDNSINNSTCLHGIESTVLKINGELRQIQIYRQGAVTQTQLEEILLKRNDNLSTWIVKVISRTVDMKHTNDVENEIKVEEIVVGQESPGQAITHYAPDVPCFIVSKLLNKNEKEEANNSNNYINRIIMPLSQLKYTVIIDFGGQMVSLSNSCLAYRDLSPSFCSADAARLLFDTLRWAELINGALKVLLPFVEINRDITHCSKIKENEEVYYDLSLGLADRIFRAASGVTNELEIDDSL
jgi:tRNA threonylcarbamoyl adenosine modification protein (Sua5/YciO/YrdC/YwlC family)